MCKPSQSASLTGPPEWEPNSLNEVASCDKEK